MILRPGQQCTEQTLRIGTREVAHCDKEVRP